MSVVLLLAWIGSGWFAAGYEFKSGSRIAFEYGTLALVHIDDPNRVPGQGLYGGAFPMGWSWRFHYLGFSTEQCLIVPLWCLVGLSLFATGAIWRFDAGARHRDRLERNRCPDCNYDLKGLANDAACPECGPTQSRKPHPQLLKALKLGIVAAVGVPIIGFAISKCSSNDGRPPGSVILTDVSKYEATRARVAQIAPARVIDAFPEHVPSTSTQTRLHAEIFPGMLTHLVLYCKLTPDEARRVAADGRGHALYTAHEWQQPHESAPHGVHYHPWAKAVLEETVGLSLPDKFESIVWENSVFVGGLGSTPTGTSSELLVSEESGIVIWSMLHYIPSPPPQPTPGDPDSTP
jgi:ssDNA-binding Zn-finger/Zn-ribbon topoisomerase 1